MIYIRILLKNSRNPFNRSSAHKGCETELKEQKPEPPLPTWRCSYQLSYPGRGQCDLVNCR